LWGAIPLGVDSTFIIYPIQLLMIALAVGTVWASTRYGARFVWAKGKSQ
jgi:hypothetical protein